VFFENENEIDRFSFFVKKKTPQSNDFTAFNI